MGMNKFYKWFRMVSTGEVMLCIMTLLLGLYIIIPELHILKDHTLNILNNMFIGHSFTLVGFLRLFAIGLQHKNFRKLFSMLCCVLWVMASCILIVEGVAIIIAIFSIVFALGNAMVYLKISLFEDEIWEEHFKCS